MDFEQDYIMRMIKQMAAAMVCMLLGRKLTTLELPPEEKYTSADGTLRDLFDLVKEGKINEAENELLASFRPEDIEEVEKAISFYSYLNELDSDFLKQHNYSKEEILAGLSNIAKKTGLGEVIDLFSGEGE